LTPDKFEAEVVEIFQIEGQPIFLLQLKVSMAVQLLLVSETAELLSFKWAQEATVSLPQAHLHSPRQSLCLSQVEPAPIERPLFSL